ncbi:hypothetical protein J4573_41400 [Actinomadura barringtoniae]|uniref:Uncharacterized protein n=1 Tax=Actinomadura barringtoniae TaxID=1427535 RepID=A0A939PJN9_9ACTN|nr:hypothetical protein [Actinomadura barringtoniae]MBO2453605.1 hypothetical protein [Actinomadura barringtoniae]
MNRRETHDRAGVKGAVMVLPDAAAWRPIAPAVVEIPHMLNGVAAASPEEIWVAGHAAQQPLLARWDGTAWAVPPGPAADAALLGAGFQGISRSSEGAIAVGGGFDRLAGTEVPLVQHWNGSSWASWTAPDAARDYVLTDVAMFGAEAWAVGHGFSWGPAGAAASAVSGAGTAGTAASAGSATRPAGPVAIHWDGKAWHPETTPPIARGKLLAVSGTSPTDVWAVGAADRAGLIMHYDGASWAQVPSPSTRFPLTGVAAIAADDAWAVGRDRVLRWNGRKWSRVKAPITAANTITALAPDDIWVAGGRGELAHFDGRRWSVTASPHPMGDTAVWLASASLPGSVWMVGSHQATSATGPVESSITARSTEN